MEQWRKQASREMILRVAFMWSTIIYYFIAWYFSTRGLTAGLAPATLRALWWGLFGASLVQATATFFMRSFIVTLALFEAIGIYGLVVGILGAPMNEVIGFTMLAGIGIATAQGTPKPKDDPREPDSPHA